MKLRPRLRPRSTAFSAATFLGPFVVCLAAFTAAYLLGDIFDRFDDLMRYGGFGLLGLEYFALKLPLIISQLLPVASLAGVLLGFALLNRTGEVLACQQLGISRLEMAVPVLLLAALISIADFAISETVVPVATREAKHLYQVQLTAPQNLRHLLQPPHLGARDRRLHERRRLRRPSEDAPRGHALSRRPRLQPHPGRARAFGPMERTRVGGRST